MRYVTANEIRKIDQLAQSKFHIPSLILMENAGIAAANEIFQYIKNHFKKAPRVCVLAGRGNNGGDGFVVARQLKAKGLKVNVFLLGNIKDIKKSDPLINLRPLKKMGILVKEITDIKSVDKFKCKFSYDLIVDAIFGTGFSGECPAFINHVLSFVNTSKLPVFSIDVPSGLDATTGQVYDNAMKATATITFGLPKTGFIKNDGPNFVGQVITRNISYPGSLLK